MPDEPITPHAGPTLDPDGQLSYVGEDGRRYVILGREDLDAIGAERVMGTLRDASDLFHQIETLSRRWLDQVSRSPLRRSEALALLLASIETALEQSQDEERGC
ncbi:hypothetical protein EVJ50_00920 [Synechococcus sp. RSCCF101]|uniref:hypothetical protein n=1 Tax=Synechococcus sp. RSCCF101 TaxID=2511069 RepID=UPI00124903AD|nr:hypothetical protein [Synechococcus sp. RSCCF101]QEY31030.1 hypothetical protein EVJ50_00920 [Synechococcus sp. RSCCF101]